MMAAGVDAALDRRAPRKRRRAGSRKPKAVAAGTSLLRSIRLCDEASLLLRKAVGARATSSAGCPRSRATFRKLVSGTHFGAIGVPVLAAEMCT